MRCPFCNNDNTKVVNSRLQEESNQVRRRRECEECDNRFTTYERMDTIPIIVIKKNGISEPFDREKILNGLIKSAYKRPVSMIDLEKLIDDIENNIMSKLDSEVESKMIGEMVMERLKDLDDVAYVRFASVYRQFKDLNSFVDELNKILLEKK